MIFKTIPPLFFFIGHAATMQDPAHPGMATATFIVIKFKPAVPVLHVAGTVNNKRPRIASQTILSLFWLLEVFRLTERQGFKILLAGQYFVRA